MPFNKEESHNAREVNVRDEKQLERIKSLIDEMRLVLSEWNGVEPLGKQHERRVQAVLDEILRQGLLQEGRHFFNMSESWLAHARRKPNSSLRTDWLELLDDWKKSTSRIDSNER